MAKKKKEVDKGLTKDNMDALQKFCDKQGIKVKAGKKFDLFKFLLEVSQKVMGLVPTAMSIERTVGGLVEKEGKDSENFGGSPCGGSVVTLDLDEDPYTGIKLSEDDGDDDDDDDDDDDSDSDDNDTDDDDDDDSDSDDDDDDDSDSDDDDDDDDDDSDSDDDDDDDDDDSDSDDDDGDTDSDDDSDWG